MHANADKAHKKTSEIGSSAVAQRRESRTSTPGSPKVSTVYFFARVTFCPVMRYIFVAVNILPTYYPALQCPPNVSPLRQCAVSNLMSLVVEHMNTRGNLRLRARGVRREQG
jgi:hypothetical protein